MYRINIDKQSDFPIYQQIIQCVLEAVKDGSLKPGDKLPTEKELCFENDIARGTVRKAYDKLQKDGIITITQGKGTFVQKERANLTSADIIDKYLEQLLALSFSLDDIALFISDKLQERGKPKTDVYLCIVDNCVEILDALECSLKRFSFPKKRFLIRDIIENGFQEVGSTSVILTLPQNIQSLEKLLPEWKSRLIPVSAGLSQNTLKNLANLPSNAKVAMLCQSRHFAEVIRREIGALDRSLSFSCFILNAYSPQALEKYIKDKTCLLVENGIRMGLSEEQKSLVQGFVSSGGSVLPLEYVIDQGSFIYIEELIHKLHFSSHRILC